MNFFTRYFRSGPALIRQAQTQLQAGKHEEALALAECGVAKLQGRRAPLSVKQGRKRANLADGWLTKGRVLRTLGQTDAAAEAYLLADQLGAPDEEEVVSFLAPLLIGKSDQRNEARTVYLRYLSRPPTADNPEEAEFLRQLEVYSAPNVDDSATLGDARAWNKEIVDRRPDLAWCFRNLGRIELAAHDWEKAIHSLRECLRLQPNDRVAQYYLAFGLYSLGEFVEAEQTLDELLAVERRPAMFLLRGRLRRLLGNPSGAVADLMRAHKSISLSPDDVFALVECLVNCGRLDTATGVLDRLPYKTNPKWLLLLAEIHRQEDRPAAALEALREIDAAASVYDSALRMMLSITAAGPTTAGAGKALDTVPDKERDDSFWIVRGKVLQSGGQYLDAVDCWRRVQQQTDQLRQAQQQLIERHLMESFHAHDDQEVLRVFESGLVCDVDSEDVRSIIVAALVRTVLAAGTTNEEQLGEFLTLAQRADQTLVHGNSRSLNLLHGMLLAALREYDSALPILQQFVDEGTANAETQMQFLRCALASDNGEMQGLHDGLAKGDPRGRRLTAALAARRGDWASAAEFLKDSVLPSNLLTVHAAVLFKANQSQALAALEPVDDGVSYFQAAGLLREGDFAAADRILSAIDGEGAFSRPTSRLWAWAGLQEVRDAYQEDGVEPATVALTKALDRWPSDEPPTFMPAVAPGCLAHAFLTLGNRQKVADALEQQAAESGLGDPLTCHNFAVFHFAEGNRLAEQDDFSEAVEHWIRSVANFGVALANFGYLQTWASGRAQAYQETVAEETYAGLDKRVLKQVESTLSQWREQALTSGAKDEAAALTDLILVMRAELKGAELIRQLGGMSAPDDTAANVSVGALYVSLYGLEETLRQFLSRLRVKRPNLSLDGLPDNPMLRALLELTRSMDDDEEDEADVIRVDEEMKNRLERLFSPLRLVWALEEEGHAAEALRRLALLNGYAGPGSAIYSNPAFCRPDSKDRYQELQTEVEISLLMNLAKSEIASSEGKTSEAISHWKQAFQAAKRVDRLESVVERVCEVAIGRADVLQRRELIDEAIALLSAVKDLCGDDRIQGELADVYANRGIQAANEDRISEAVDDLRQAYELKEQSTHIKSHLSIFLRLKARETFANDEQAAVAMLQESAQLGADCAREDPYNDRFRDIAAMARSELAAANMATGQMSEDSLLELFGGADPERMSTFYHNRGVEKADEADFVGAIEDFEKALELEPTSEVTKNMLLQCLMVQAHASHDQGNLVESLQYVMRANNLE